MWEPALLDQGDIQDCGEELEWRSKIESGVLIIYSNNESKKKIKKIFSGE